MTGPMREVRLGPYPERFTERLVHFANVAPERVLFAERDARGAWRSVTYAEALDSIRRIGAASCVVASRRSVRSRSSPITASRMR